MLCSSQVFGLVYENYRARGTLILSIKYVHYTPEAHFLWDLKMNRKILGNMSIWGLKWAFLGPNRRTSIIQLGYNTTQIRNLPILANFFSNF